MVVSEPGAPSAGYLWTHPNGIGFRSGIHGLGLNGLPPHGYPHSHGLYKREAGPEADAHLGYYSYGGYYGYPRYGPLNGPGYLGHTGSIHGLHKREAEASYYEHRSPQGARGHFYPHLSPYHHHYGIR